MFDGLRKLVGNRDASQTDRDAETPYWAFISYDHDDAPAARRLQKALESYRVPRELVGETTPMGEVPDRLYPCFLDNSELGALAELTPALEQALERARSLIVLASPESAESPWVDLEIRHFKSLGRSDRVLVALASEEEVFPAAAVPQGEPEPRWVNLRQRSYRKAVLELIAGVIGIEFGRIYRRDRMRARKRAAAGALGLVLAGVLGTGLAARIQSERLAQRGGSTPTIRVENALRAVEFWRSPEADSALRASMESLRERAAVDLGGTPTAMDFSPTGGQLAALVDGRLAVWDPAAPSEVKWLPSYAHPPDSIRMSADGPAVLGWSARGVQLWSMTAGTLGASITPTEGVRLAAIGPRGEVVVTLDAEGAVSTWAPPWDRPLASVSAPGHATTLAIGPSGTVMLGTTEGRVLTWNGRPGPAVYWQAHDAAVTALAFSGGDTIATADENGVVHTWRVGISTPVWTATGSRRELAKLVFSPDGTRLAGFQHAFDGDDAKRVLLFEPGRDGLAREFAEHPDRLADIAFSTDGRLLATAAGDSIVRLWPGSQLGTKAPVDSLVGHTADVVLARFLPEPNGGLVSLDEAGTIRFWDWRGGLTPTVIAAGGPRAKFDAEGTRVLTVSAEGEATVWDARSGAPVWRAPRGALRDAAFGPGPDQFTAATGSGGLITWTCQPGHRPPCQLPAETALGHPSVASLAGALPSGLLLGASPRGVVYLLDPELGVPLDSVPAPRNAGVTVATDGTVGLYGRDGFALVWTPGEDRAVLQLEGIVGDVLDLRFSPDGAEVITTSDAGTIQVWDAEAGTALASIQPDSTPTLALLTGSGRAVFATGRRLASWDPASGELDPFEVAHSGYVQTLAQDAASGLIATGAADGTAYLWTEDGERRAVLPNHNAPLWEAQFMRAGTRLFTYDELERVRVFELQLDALRQIADSLLGSG